MKISMYYTAVDLYTIKNKIKNLYLFFWDKRLWIEETKIINHISYWKIK
jgi:hypothetical protein